MNSSAGQAPGADAPRLAASRGWLEEIAQRIVLSHGRRRALIAWVAGAFGALAMPPFGLFPALIPSLVVAIWLVDGAGAGARPLSRFRQASFIGWLWGFGYMTAGLWWLGSAFLVEADRFAWAIPFGVLGLPAVLGLFYAAGFGLAALVWSRGAGRVLAFACGLALAEWLRGHLFTGFPWNTLGMALGSHLWTMQAASVIGLYGLTLLTVAIAAAPATLPDREERPSFGPSLVALAVLLGLAAFGAWRVPSSTDPSVPGVRLRLIQPAIQQDAKFQPENRERIVDKYLELSDRAASPERGGIGDVTHLIWPESAFPFLLQRDPETLERIGRVIPPGKHLITGAARAQEPFTREHAVFFNAILSIANEGALGDVYDKVHLVPFGEYLPSAIDSSLRAIGIRQFIAVPGGFTAGNRETQRILSVPGLPPIAATICYEAIFPGAILPPAPADGSPQVAGMILNLTNDAWFGDTPGPRQHFAQARLRAVEEGLPLVRDANNGVTAVVDPHGRVVASLPFGGEGVLDSSLPARLPGQTIYARFGDAPFWLMLVIAFLIAGLTKARAAGRA